jgi:phosphoglucosamine mutase
MGKLFGTDGVRGVANRGLTAELALRLGRAGAYILTRENDHAPKILLAKDTRRSGDMLEAALTAGLCSLGAEVYTAGTIPTPAVAYLIKKYGLDAGVMISASHNPMADNGIKFFNHDGYKLPDILESEIERLYLEGKTRFPQPEGVHVGAVRHCPEASKDYADYLHTSVPGLNLKNISVALDCANGATSHLAETVFARLGAKTHTLFSTPDGININDNCGSMFLGPLSDYVKTHSIDIGLAFDGDGDRMLCVDGNGEPVNGDEIIAVCAAELHKQGKLSNDTLVGTVMSNMGLTIMCKKLGINLLQTDVGDRYVVEKMLAGDYTLGGEQSGHIIFKDYSTTGDGMLTGLQLLSVMKQRDEPLSMLKKTIEVLPQVMVNAAVPNDKKHLFNGNRILARAIAEVENQLKGEGRVLVRPSGTEPLVRVMIEGRDQKQINEWAGQIARQIERELVNPGD